MNERTKLNEIENVQMQRTRKTFIIYFIDKMEYVIFLLNIIIVYYILNSRN